jgi:general secretion pathway protein I
MNRSFTARHALLRRPVSGFTLIEVVVAIAIVALGLGALFNVLANTASNIGSLRERTFASWIANNRIAEVRLGTVFPSVERTTGELEYAGSKWRYEQVVSQTAVEGLRRIDVRVGPKDAAASPGGEDVYTLTVSGFVGMAQQASPPSTAGWSGVVTVGTGGDAAAPQQVLSPGMKDPGDAGGPPQKRPNNPPPPEPF